MRTSASWLLLILISMLAGCAGATTTVCPSDTREPSTEPTTRPAATGEATTQTPAAEPPAAPFVIREAALPRDFPAPGPVGVVLEKSYPPCRAARVRASDLPGGRQDDMFMSLFHHIQKEDIAMTAPVVMGFAPGVDGPASRPAPHPPESMAFLYADPGVGKTEHDGSIAVVDLPAMTVLSVGVRGSYDRAHFEEGMGKIDAWLKAHPGEYAAARPPRFLGYNSPFVPWFMRYGEVQLPVRACR